VRARGEPRRRIYLGGLNRLAEERFLATEAREMLPVLRACCKISG
jgi:hypothetical protein